MNVYTLSDEGRSQVLNFIKSNGNARVIEHLDTESAIDSWLSSVDCTEEGLGHLEMAGRYTHTGNPVTVTFGPECFDCEEVLED